MYSADIRLVVGTRPEAIKMGPVARALEERGFSPKLVLTGQQALDLSGTDPGHRSTIFLNCPGQLDPHGHAEAVAAAMMEPQGDAPDLIVVQGDTSSAMGAASAGFRANIPVAHVEAGLRTFDHAQPWPEEEYRTAIDARADLLFAPTRLAADNLRRERVPGIVHVTGNTGIDALLELAASLPLKRQAASGPRILVTCHRRENWRDGLGRIAEAVRTIAADRLAEVTVVLHPNAHVATGMRRALIGAPGINLLPPLSHRELVLRMRDADLILSDSGGIQEEAPALGTPLLVLRSKTERPEGIATGNMRLVGTDADPIVDAVRGLLSDPSELARMSRPALPYGDGRAGPRIAAIIEDWLSGRAVTLKTSASPLRSGSESARR